MMDSIESMDWQYEYKNKNWKRDTFNCYLRYKQITEISETRLYTSNLKRTKIMYDINSFRCDHTQLWQWIRFLRYFLWIFVGLDYIHLNRKLIVVNIIIVFLENLLLISSWTHNLSFWILFLLPMRLSIEITI